LENSQLVSKGENLRLQCGAAPKTRGDHGTKADENRVHDGDDYDLTNDRKLCVCRSDGVFSTHNYKGSEHFEKILAILGREHRRDALHVDSAFMSRCAAFITRDSDILKHKVELLDLLGISFFDPDVELRDLEAPRR
jgi:hypothetical protein